MHSVLQANRLSRIAHSVRFIHSQSSVFKMATPHNLDKLFYVPSAPLSPSFPLRWPGVTAKSGKALVETLKRDFVDYHVFFDDLGRHKYVQLFRGDF
jgi:hypothetical protein